MNSPSTIVARATPEGTSAIAVLRLSGSKTAEILNAVVKTRLAPGKRPRSAQRCQVLDTAGRVIDDGLLFFFPGPASYTGEDLAEVHVHGGEVVVREALLAMLEAGAELAGPGEFTRRAFEHGKLDLGQAEAVIQIIEADTLARLVGANRVLAGEFRTRIDSLREEVMEALARIEAVIEFAEEDDVMDLPMKSVDHLQEQVSDLRAQVVLAQEAGLRVVIAGRPNVGKSSILNLLGRKELAIVCEEAGTTRDAVMANLILRGNRVTLVDTAGRGETIPEGLAAREADRKALSAVQAADAVLWVTDDPKEPVPVWVEPLGGDEKPAELARPRCVLAVCNKKDLLDPASLALAQERFQGPRFSLICAKTGEGAEGLETKLAQVLEELAGKTDGMPVSLRQFTLLAGAEEHLRKGAEALRRAEYELAALDLRAVTKAVDELTGRLVEEDILDLVFSRFCIGK